ncbi:MAG: LptF/LptG family permease, partial [Candidatus Marinimicrobia bacterium]|nr:LptF/LptG family permease [Candidatus Neomarinimicrobiota bacterium]
QTIDDAILLNLEDGEIHELSLPDYDEYRRLKFAKHRIVIPVDNLYLERRESEQRGDREMDIGMMQAKIEGYLGKIETVNARIANRITSQTPYHLTGDTSQVATKALMSRWKQAIADSAQLSPGESARLARRANNLERGLTGDYNLLRSYRRGINRYKVEIYKKFAIPFACIAFIIVGAPIGIRARRGGFAVASALSLGFFVIYWALLIAGEELADRALVPPFLAMWAANILLTIIGLLMIWQIHNEHRFWRLDILDLFRKRNIADDDDTAIQQS